MPGVICVTFLLPPDIKSLIIVANLSIADVCEGPGNAFGDREIFEFLNIFLKVNSDVIKSLVVSKAPC